MENTMYVCFIRKLPLREYIRWILRLRVAIYSYVGVASVCHQIFWYIANNHTLIPPIPTTPEASSAEAAMGRDPAAAAKVPDEPAPAQSEDMMPRSEISDSMKARLRRELESQGANPNKSAGNPILVVAAVVGLLVIVGGKGETK